MDCIMSITTHANKIIQIPHARVEILTLVGRERINMMYDDAVVNLIPFDTEIEAEVSRDDFTPSFLPNSTLVESLVHPPRPAKCLTEEGSFKRQIRQPLLK